MAAAMSPLPELVRVALVLAAPWLDVPGALAVRGACAVARDLATRELGARIRSGVWMHGQCIRGGARFIRMPPCARGAARWFIRLIAANMPPDIFRRCTWRVFHWACLVRDTELASWLRGDSPLAVIGRGSAWGEPNLLKNACARGHVGEAQWLWAGEWAGRPLSMSDLSDEARTDLVRVSCEHGRTELPQWLRSVGFELSDFRRGRGGAFRRACARGELELAQWLLATGITLAEARSGSCAAHRLAMNGGHWTTIEWLESVGAA